MSLQQPLGQRENLQSRICGYITTASGYASTAMGANTTAETYGQITIGMYNTTLAGSTTVFDEMTVFL